MLSSFNVIDFVTVQEVFLGYGLLFLLFLGIVYPHGHLETSFILGIECNPILKTFKSIIMIERVEVGLQLLHLCFYF